MLKNLLGHCFVHGAFQDQTFPQNISLRHYMSTLKASYCSLTTGLVSLLIRESSFLSKIYYFPLGSFILLTINSLDVTYCNFARSLLCIRSIKVHATSIIWLNFDSCVAMFRSKTITIMTQKEIGLRRHIVSTIPHSIVDAFGRT